jgi:ABC-type branched-subunit amino acid transport system substrate-binding protein
MAGTDLHLAVLVPTATSWPAGRDSIGAIALAIDDANAHGALGGGRTLKYSWAEVDCDRFQAGTTLNKILADRPVDALIGPDCSSACESTASVTAVRGIPQISYSCMSSELSDKTKFPTVRLGLLRISAAQPIAHFTSVGLGSLCARPRPTRAGHRQSSALPCGQSGRG